MNFVMVWKGGDDMYIKTLPYTATGRHYPARAAPEKALR